CSPLGVPRNLTVRTTVDLEPSGSNSWIARSVSSDPSNLVLQFSTTGVRQMGGDEIVGTISGSARDLGDPPFLPANDTIVSLDGSPVTALSGTVTSTSFVNGRLAGPIVMSDSLGGKGQCPAVAWTMQSIGGG